MFFHFLQCQIRHFQALKLLKKEVKNKAFQLLSLIIFPCFIEPKKIDKVYEEFKVLFTDDFNKEYFSYFEQTWLFSFSRELWNFFEHYKHLSSSFQRANNVLESFHSLLLY